jgi:hypothetical protein
MFENQCFSRMIPLRAPRLCGEILYFLTTAEDAERCPHFPKCPPPCIDRANPGAVASRMC